MGKFTAPPTIMADLEIDGNTLSVDATNDRVGIGVSDPDSKLEVLATTTQLKLSYDGSNASTFTVASDGDTTWTATDAIVDASGDIELNAGGGDIVFKKAGAEYMRVKDGGNVGIGVNDPDASLEILDTTTQLKLSYNGSNASTFTVANDGNLSIQPGGNIISHGGAMGGAGIHSKLIVRKTGITDETATGIVRFTVPNGNHAASVRITGFASSSNKVRTHTHEIAIARKINNDSVAVTTTPTTAFAESGGGAGTLTITTTLDIPSNTNGTNQIEYQLNINEESADSASDVVLCVELLNFNASGITMAAI